MKDFFNLIFPALGFALLSCGVQSDASHRFLEVTDISNSKKKGRHAVEDERKLESYQAEIVGITRSKWDFFCVKSGGFGSSGTAELAFVVSPDGKVESISISNASDPVIARIGKQAILACTYPPIPKSILEILNGEKFICRFDFIADVPPKPHIQLKNDLLTYE